MRNAWMVAACLLAAVAVPAACAPDPDNGADPAFRDTVRAHQRLIADCMNERGFEYVAGLPKSALADEARRRAEAAGEDKRAAMERDLAGVADPNERLVAALPPERQALWGNALWGDANRVGCHDLTYEAAWGISLDDLAVKGEALLAKVEAEPAVAEARRSYSRCMAARGHTLDRPNDLEAMIGRETAHLEGRPAEAHANRVLADHKACTGPYDKVFTETYDRLSP